MDLASGRRTTLLVGLAVVAGLYWLAMFVGTHIPAATAPTHDPYFLDKLKHFSAFAGLAVLLCCVGAAYGFTSRVLYIGTFLLIALYGIFDETSQALVSHRSPDVFDWLADMIGATLGIAAFWSVCRLRTGTAERRLDV